MAAGIAIIIQSNKGWNNTSRAQVLQTNDIPKLENKLRGGTTFSQETMSVTQYMLAFNSICDIGISLCITGYGERSAGWVKKD
jgi:hypothetical protein